MNEKCDCEYISYKNLLPSKLQKYFTSGTLRLFYERQKLLHLLDVEATQEVSLVAV